MSSIPQRERRLQTKELRGKLTALRRENKQLRKDAYRTYEDGGKILWKTEYEVMYRKRGEAKLWLKTARAERDKWHCRADAQQLELDRLNARVAELGPLEEQVREQAARNIELQKQVTYLTDANHGCSDEPNDD